MAEDARLMITGSLTADFRMALPSELGICELSPASERKQQAENAFSLHLEKQGVSGLIQDL